MGNEVFQEIARQYPDAKVIKASSTVKIMRYNERKEYMAYDGKNYAYANIASDYIHRFEDEPDTMAFLKSTEKYIPKRPVPDGREYAELCNLGYFS